MTHPRHQNFALQSMPTPYEVVKMRDLNWLKERQDLISRYVKVEKICFETHRDMWWQMNPP
jgi:hypothetical protein